MRAGADVDLPGRLPRPLRLAGHADFLMRVPTPSALGAHSYEVSTRSSRARRSPTTSSSSASTPSSSRASRGASPTQMHVVLGSGEHRVLQAGGVRRVLPRASSAARGVRRGSAAHRAVADRALRHLRLQAASATRTGTRSTTSRRVAGIRRTQIDKLHRSPASPRSPRSGARPREPPPGICRRHLREDPRAGRAPAPRARDRRATSTTPPAAAGRGLRAPARPVARRPLLRLRGQPVLGQGRQRSSTSGGCSTPTRDFTPLHAHDRASERAAFEQFVDLVHDRLRAYPGMHVYHYAQYEITALKRLDGLLRHARGRARRPPAPRRLRRPATGRAQRHPRVAAAATG